MRLLILYLGRLLIRLSTGFSMLAVAGLDRGRNPRPLWDWWFTLAAMGVIAVAIFR